MLRNLILGKLYLFLERKLKFVYMECQRLFRSLNFKKWGLKTVQLLLCSRSSSYRWRGWDGDVWDCNKEEIGFTLKLSCVRQAGEVRGAGDSVVIFNGGW